MTGRPFRFPPSTGQSRIGRLIDRSRTVRFSFDGQELEAYPGDTLASALLANGTRLVGRSFRRHRPRGIVGMGTEEPNALVTTGSGRKHTPNVLATTLEVTEGLRAWSQNRWPDLARDRLAVLDRFARFLPSGFYYKAFKRPGRVWPLYEQALRRTAGLGKAPRRRDPDRYEHVHVSCDLFVAGGGPAGLAAALAAVETGARVILADENPRLGGQADLYDGTVDGSALHEWVRRAVLTLARSDRAKLLVRTTAAGLYQHRFIVLREVLCEEDGPRERLWFVRAARVVIATGAIERPLLFGGNDRPGVMLSRAARAYAIRYAVAPGTRGLVLTANDDGYRTAAVLKLAGVDIAVIVDLRPTTTSWVADRAKVLGIPLRFGSSIAKVDAAKSGVEITSATVADLHASGRRENRREVLCDFVLTAGGDVPVASLYGQLGGMLAQDEAIGAPRPRGSVEGVAVIGSANGTFALEPLVEEAFLVGERFGREAAGSRASGRSARRPTVEATEETPPGQDMAIPPPDVSREEQFVDFQNDVSVADVRLALREGYCSLQHLKRYSGLSLGPDQGRTAIPNAVRLVAAELNLDPVALGTTTSRPPAAPVTFGAVAGARRGRTFSPVRATPMTGWHSASGAVFEPDGLWRRPFAYPRNGETPDLAARREARTARGAAGLIDLSTLGKLEVIGPDAAAFLDLVLATSVGTLRPGRCRYALMLDEQGYVVDDGIVVRLHETRFLLQTSTNNADRTAVLLERWHQIEWPDLRVFIVPVTETWAQMALTGPRSREVFARLRPSFSVEPESFPPFSFCSGLLADIPVRAFRIGYAGGLSFEFACPAPLGPELWSSLAEAGREFGLEPVGTEALHALRCEMGFIAVGHEADGTATPDDLGLSRLTAREKADFIGKRGLERDHLRRPDRPKLVGLLSADGRDPLPVGTQIVTSERRTADRRGIGHVSSSHYSAVLDRPIALAMLEHGRERTGEILPLVDPFGATRWGRVTASRFVELDAEGQRHGG